MALIKTTPLIESIHGRFGGVYFKRDRYGHHLQAMPLSCRKASMQSSPMKPEFTIGSRSDNISAFSSAAWAWVIVFALGLILLWTGVAEQFMYDDGRTGGRRKLSGYNWFLKFNVKRAYRKLPLYYHPPHSPTDLPIKTTAGKYFGMDTINWYIGGIYNGKVFFETDDGKWKCWWLDPSWIISDALGQHEIPPYWYHLGEDPNGLYIGTAPFPEPVIVCD